MWSQECNTSQGSLTMVLVLVQPFVAVVCEQLVLSKRCVDEAVHEGRGQVHASGIHLGAAASKPCRAQSRGEMWYHFTTQVAVSALSLLKTLPSKLTYCCSPGASCRCHLALWVP